MAITFISIVESVTGCKTIWKMMGNKECHVIRNVRQKLFPESQLYHDENFQW